MNKKDLELLFRSFDDELNPDEKKKLETALSKSNELREQKQKIESMRKAIKTEEKPHFGYMFADKVMQKIESAKNKSNDELFYESILSVFRPVAIAATLIFVFLLSYNIIQKDSNILSNSNTASDMNLVEAFDPYNELSLEN